MQRPATTRMELIERRAQVALARRGRDLLERKRSAIMLEGARLRKRLGELRHDLAIANDRAAESLAEAEALAGQAAVSAAALRPVEAAIGKATANLSGVRVPVLRRLPSYGQPLPTVDRSPAVAAAGAAYSVLADAIVRVAEAQAQWAAIDAEARRLARQVNALDTMVIPRLLAECTDIELALEERERAARYQLKLVQRRLGLRQEA